MSPALPLVVSRPRVIGTALFVGSFLLYAATRSISLDDFDSFNFARAIDRFDVAANQPQPPGYPVYVLLARLFDLATHDHQLALTLLSALSGAVMVVAFYALARDHDAAWAALAMALMPLFWLSSGMALSDVPGLACATIATLLLARGASSDAQYRRRSFILAGAAATGLTLGIRPQDAIVPSGVFLLWALPQMLRWRKGRLATLMLAAAVFTGVCLMWAMPLVVSLGGIGRAAAVLAGQSSYVGTTDSLLARPLIWPNVEARLAELGSVFGAYFGGPREAGFPAMAALAGALVALAAWAGRVRWLALAWLAPYAVFMVLFLRPDDPRKVLAAIPPMLLLLAGLRPKALGAAACVALAGWFAYAALPLVRTLDTIESPPEQAAAYVRATFSSDDTLVVAGSSYNAIRYRDPAFKAYLLDDLDPASVRRELESGTYRNLVLLDKDGFAAPESFVGVDTRTFRRDPLVLPKASTVWLATFRPLSELRDRDLALPSGPVRIGAAEDVRYVSEGWYRPEQIAGVTARWTDKEAKLRFWSDRAADASLRLTGAAYPPGEQLTILVNGHAAGTLPMLTDWAPYTVQLPAALLQADAINTISLDHSVTRSAYDATQGLSLDRRPLAAAYSSFELTWR